MKLCRFTLPGQSQPRVGLVDSAGALHDLSAGGIDSLSALLEFEGLLAELDRLASLNLPKHEIGAVRLLSPVERQEVWAAGVTYLRSKKARMEESDFSATAYDRVYDAERPEIFFKSMPEKVVASGEAVGIRRDAKWNVPEPELILVLNSRGHCVGYAVGNDMSSRDIEGENLLYLPQAKIYDRSCAIGPFIAVGVTEEAARSWSIQVQIRRDGATVFEGQTSVGQIKRSFPELSSFLFRSQRFPHGVCLLTGTGVVPADTFTLAVGDEVHIHISGIGSLVNSVIEV